MFATDLSWNDLVFMLQGAWVSVAVTAWAVAGGIALGIVLGQIRAASPLLVNWPLGAILDVFRSVPLLIQLVVANSFKSIVGLSWSPFTVSCVVLALYTSAYCAEIARGGILAVPQTTRRAGRSLGMTYWQDLRYIVAPIAFRVALPGITGLIIAVVKDSSLVLWIGMIELLRASQIIVTRIHEPMFVLSIAGLIYFAICFPISFISSKFERRWHGND
jgi:polar amino acid transport system permease protein